MKNTYNNIFDAAAEVLAGASLNESPTGSFKLPSSAAKKLKEWGMEEITEFDFQDMVDELIENDWGLDLESTTVYAYNDSSNYPNTPWLILTKDSGIYTYDGTNASRKAVLQKNLSKALEEIARQVMGDPKKALLNAFVDGQEPPRKMDKVLSEVGYEATSNKKSAQRLLSELGIGNKYPVLTKIGPKYGSVIFVWANATHDIVLYTKQKVFISINRKTKKVIASKKLDTKSLGLSKSDDKETSDYWLYKFFDTSKSTYKKESAYLSDSDFIRQDMQTGKLTDPINSVAHVVKKLAPKYGGIVAYWYSPTSEEHVLVLTSGKWVYIDEFDKKPIIVSSVREI